MRNEVHCDVAENLGFGGIRSRVGCGTSRRFRTCPGKHDGGIPARVEMGARFIETDLHLTRDARVVAIHDLRLTAPQTAMASSDVLPLKEVRATRCRRVVWIPRGRIFCRGARSHSRLKSFGLRGSAHHLLPGDQVDGTWGVEHASSPRARHG